MQSVAIKISISGLSLSLLSFDLGEKFVNILLNSVLIPVKLVLGFSLPVTIAEYNPNSSKTYFEIFSYRYLAVSAKAVKIIIFLFSLFNGLSTFFFISSCNSISFLSLSVVILFASFKIFSSINLSASNSDSHFILSISFKCTLTFLLPIKTLSNLVSSISNSSTLKSSSISSKLFNFSKVKYIFQNFRNSYSK